jgi:hypothetical protein
MRIEGWRRKAQDRDQWRRISQEAKAHVGLQRQVMMICNYNWPRKSKYNAYFTCCIKLPRRPVFIIRWSNKKTRLVSAVCVFRLYPNQWWSTVVNCASPTNTVNTKTPRVFTEAGDTQRANTWILHYKFQHSGGTDPSSARTSVPRKAGLKSLRRNTKFSRSR